MSKKFVEAIRNSEEYLNKMRAELPPELQKFIDFLFKASFSNVDDDFFNEIFESKSLDTEECIWFNGNRYNKQKDGYYRSLNGKFLHRKIWKHFNGEIPEGYVIHHIDGDPSNNDLENLQMVTRSEHVKLHMAVKKYVCKFCGKEFESKGNVKGECYFCSENCSDKWYYRNNQEIRICEECGKEFYAYKYKKIRFCSKECLKKGRSRIFLEKKLRKSEK